MFDLLQTSFSFWAQKTLVYHLTRHWDYVGLCVWLPPQPRIEFCNLLLGPCALWFPMKHTYWSLQSMWGPLRLS